MSFSIMALVIGFVLGLVLTALVLQIIFQVLVVSNSLDVGWGWGRQGDNVFGRLIVAELHKRAHQIIFTWANNAIKCAEFTADAIRDKRVNLSDTGMVAKYLHQQHISFGMGGNSVSSSNGEIFGVEAGETMLDQFGVMVSPHEHVFVTNRQLDARRFPFNGIDEPLVAYRLDLDSRFEVESGSVREQRYDLCNQPWYMDTRQRQSANLIGPKIEYSMVYRTDLTTAPRALVSFNACVPILEHTGPQEWGRVTDRCGAGAAKHISCCGSSYAELTNILTEFDQGLDSVAFLLDVADGKLIAATSSAEGPLNIVNVFQGEAVGYDRVLATAHSNPLIRRVGQYIADTKGSWVDSNGSVYIESEGNETGIHFAAKQIHLGPENWYLDPMSGIWAPNLYNLSGGSWSVVVVLPESEFRKYSIEARKQAQVRYYSFQIQVFFAAIFLLMAFTIVAFFVARLISVPVNDLRKRMEIVQSDEFVNKITKTAEDSHISEIRTIQQLLNLTVDRLILFDKYVPITVRQQLTSQKPNDRKIAGNLWMELRQITIIHTCLDGFARLRELTSMDAMLHLNEEYVSQAMGIIEVLGGTIEDVSGDKIVSFWMDEPVECPNHAELACQAVLRMQEAANACIKRWKTEHLSKHLDIQFSAGILTTDTFVGNFGTPTRLRYGVSGDGISQSLRLLNLTRIYNAPVIATSSTLEGAAYLSIAVPNKPERVIVTTASKQEGHLLQTPPDRSWRGMSNRTASIQQHAPASGRVSLEQETSEADRRSLDSHPGPYRRHRLSEDRRQSKTGFAAILPWLGFKGKSWEAPDDDDAQSNRSHGSEAAGNQGYLQMVQGVKAAFDWTFVAKVPAMESTMRLNASENATAAGGGDADPQQKVKAFVEIYQLRGRKVDDETELKREASGKSLEGLREDDDGAGVAMQRRGVDGSPVKPSPIARHPWTIGSGKFDMFDMPNTRNSGEREQSTFREKFTRKQSEITSPSHTPHALVKTNTSPESRSRKQSEILSPSHAVHALVKSSTSPHAKSRADGSWSGNLDKLEARMPGEREPATFRENSTSREKFTRKQSGNKTPPHAPRPLTKSNTSPTAKSSFDSSWTMRRHNTLGGGQHHQDGETLASPHHGGARRVSPPALMQQILAGAAHKSESVKKSQSVKSQIASSTRMVSPPAPVREVRDLRDLKGGFTISADLGFVAAGDASMVNTSVVSASSLAEPAHGQVTLDSKIQMWRATVQNIEASSDSSPEYEGSLPGSPPAWEGEKW